MPRVIHGTLVSLRELLITGVPFIVIAAVLLWGANHFLKPTPPKRVVLATGSDLGAYAAFGRRYQEELQRYGVEVVLRPSAGSRENMRLLQDPKQDVQIAFVQGGATETRRSAEETGEEDDKLPVMSLGSMFYEPVWIFYRARAAKTVAPNGVLTQALQFKGMRVNTGAPGSGIPGIVNRILAANHMERADIQRSSLDLTPAVTNLLAGKLDAMVMVSAPESLLVQMLLQTPGINLYEFHQAEAYSRRYRYLNPVALPRGVVDLPRNVPPRDLAMIAATCSLVAREDLHPALVQLFVQAAARIHSAGGWISKTGQFPTQQNTEFPLARDAERYYRNGPPALQRYLPFWLANFVDRMWVALFSIAVILIPLARVVPPLYNLRIRSRIYRWYRHLRQIEDALGAPGADRAALLTKLDELDAKIEHLAVPLAYADELYTLRSHISLVRERLLQPMPG